MNCSQTGEGHLFVCLQYKCIRVDFEMAMVFSLGRKDPSPFTKPGQGDKTCTLPALPCPALPYRDDIIEAKRLLRAGIPDLKQRFERLTLLAPVAA